MSSWDFEPRSVAAIQVSGQESRLTTLRSTSDLLYDLNLLYEISRLATDPQYHDFKFSNFVWTRKGRPIRPEDMLRVGELSMKSPFSLIVWIPLFGLATGGIWGLIQAAEKIADWRVNREIRRMERDKLARDLQVGDPNAHGLDEILSARGAKQYHGALNNTMMPQLSDSPKMK